MSSQLQADAFVADFFGSGNAIQLDSLPGEYRGWLQPWLDDLGNLEERPVVLPRRRPEGLFWYALATSPRQARSLREDLTAFVGPSYSDFTGQLADLDPADPVDRAVFELTAGNAFRFQILPDQIREARAALDLMRSTWGRRPSRAQVEARPVGRLIRDFNMALVAEDAGESEALLAVLGSSGRLTAANLAFLKIQRLASLGRWQELLDQPETQTVVQMRRPIAVTEALIRAVYGVVFGDSPGAFDRDEMLRRFRSGVLPRYAPLFTARSTMRSREATRLFMMLAATTLPPRGDLAQEILADSTLDRSERDFLAQIVKDVSKADEASTTPPAMEAGAAIQEGDFDRAMAILKVLPPSLITVPMLLRCAYEQNSLGATSTALAAIDELGANDRERVLSQRACAAWWEALKTMVGVPSLEGAAGLPQDWLEWLDRLNTSGPFAGAVEVAALGASEWRLDALADDPKRIAAIADALLVSREADAQAVLRNSAPHLVTFLRQAEEPLPALRPIYLSAILLIASDERLGGSDLAVLLDLVSDVFGMGVSPGEYEELVGYLGETWATAGSPRRVDWCLDALDCLATYPAKVAASRIAFVAAAIQSLAPWGRRLEEYQVKLLVTLGTELGAAELVESVVAMREKSAPEGGPPLGAQIGDALSGRKIGIYTLTEAVGRHVRDVLLSIQPAVEVVLNHDKVGTDRLRSLAQDADIFLVATRSAKHAATLFIDATRPSNRTTIFAPGKGSASMLRSLFAHLASTG